MPMHLQELHDKLSDVLSRAKDYTEDEIRLLLQKCQETIEEVAEALVANGIEEEDEFDFISFVEEDDEDDEEEEDDNEVTQAEVDALREEMGL